MNFEIFLFLLFMSFVSFAVGVIVCVAIVRFFGRGSQKARILSYILIPIIALGYNFLVLTAGKWRYLVGFLPIALIIGYVLYYRFRNRISSGGKVPSPDGSARPGKNGRRSANSVSMANRKKSKEERAMFKKIVVPVDGSESAWRALEQAAVLACKFEGELLVMTVIQPYNNAALLAVPLDHNIISQSNADLEEVGREVLARARDRVDASGFTGKAEYKIELGHPSERILTIAKAEKADAIVLGSRGLSGIAEFFLGSVSTKISQYANIPVLIVK